MGSGSKTGAIEKLGWEGTWSLATLILLTLFQFVPGFHALEGLKVAAGINGFACGATLALLYLLEIGDGRTWPGGVLPLAFAGWGIALAL